MSELTEFNPEDIPDTPVEVLLDSLSLGVMRSNISQQIKGAISSQQNFLSVVIDKFEQIDQNIEDPDVQREIQMEIIDFCHGLILEITDLYNLGFDDSYSNSKKLIEILTVLYSFFVLRSKEFVCSFFKNYIQKEKNHLIELVGKFGDIDEKVSDVTSISYEKKKISKENTWVISHMDTIINFIMSNEIDPLDFIETINDGDYYITQLYEYFLDGIICGNFTNQYIANYMDEYNAKDCIEIRNEIRLSFLSEQGE